MVLRDCQGGTAKIHGERNGKKVQVIVEPFIFCKYKPYKQLIKELFMIRNH